MSNKNRGIIDDMASRRPRVVPIFGDVAYPLEPPGAGPSGPACSNRRPVVIDVVCDRPAGAAPRRTKAG
jgi:hypothetical protein